MSAHVRAALLGNTSVSAKQPSDWEDYVDFQALRDGSKEINPSNWSYGCFLPSCIFPFNTAYSACTWPLYFLSVLFEGEWKLWTSSLKDRGSPTLNVLVPDSQMSYPSPEWDAYSSGLKGTEHSEQETNNVDNNNSISKSMETKFSEGPGCLLSGYNKKLPFSWCLLPWMHGWAHIH